MHAYKLIAYEISWSGPGTEVTYGLKGVSPYMGVADYHDSPGTYTESEGTKRTQPLVILPKKSYTLVREAANDPALKIHAVLADD